MATVPPGLVWLASYPKSGNTWMRVLLSNLTAGGDAPVDINKLPEDDIPISRRRFTDDTLVDPGLLDRRELDRMRPAYHDFIAAQLTTAFFCKTHDCFTNRDGAPALGTAARGALYLLRDPRDVAVSLAHHFARDLDVVVAMMTDARWAFGGGRQIPYLLGDWAGHVAGWTEQRLIPVKAVRYEDLRADPAAGLADILTFLGVTATDGEIRRAVGHSDLAELQRQENAGGFVESQPGQERFFRSGRVGEWREVLELCHVAAIENRFGPVMERWGYALSA
jgi:aryl sulfotransferase